jgi:hypothetical protein
VVFLGGYEKESKGEKGYFYMRGIKIRKELQ